MLLVYVDMLLRYAIAKFGRCAFNFRLFAQCCEEFVALLGKKVLLVGLDIRKPRLSTLFDINDKNKGITRILVHDDPTWADICEQIAPSEVNRNLDLLMAGPIPPNPAELLQRESLDKIFEILRQQYDYIIIDCSPSLGLITVNSLAAADSVMIPVQPEFFALEGLGKLLQTIRLVQNGINPDLNIEGFVVTMFDGRTKVHNQVLTELREHFKDMVFETIIQRNIRLSEAPSHGKPIILYDVICNGTTNYLNLAKEVLERNS